MARTEEPLVGIIKVLQFLKQTTTFAGFLRMKQLWFIQLVLTLHGNEESCGDPKF
jgi:hypothetical protein